MSDDASFNIGLGIVVQYLSVGSTREMLDLEGEDFLATDDHGFLHTPKDSIQYPGLSLCRFCKNLEHQLEL
jgi:hypothetical protein